jgi:CheY-like chemotaxis protein
VFPVSDSAREREGWRANEKGLGHRRPRTFARHLVRTLTEAKYEIAGEGASGKSALTLARSAGPDVIVMAVGLRDMDGIEAAREMMRAQPLPIVLITSHYDAATIERAKQAGVMGYLVKPLNKIKEYKKEKDGLDILDDIPRYAADGWESITDSDKEPVSRQTELKACAVRLRKVLEFPLEDN